MKNNNEYIDKLIKWLEHLKEENVQLKITPPHIEEISSSLDGKIYGIMEADIHIEYKDLYEKTDSVLSNWKKLSR